MTGIEPGFFVCRARITGIFQTGRRLQIKQSIKVGDRLALRRDKSNKYDACAVKVTDGMTGQSIGYLERSENAACAFMLDSGEECVAIVADTDKTAVTVGVLVNVYCLCDKARYAELTERFAEHIRQINVNENKGDNR